ncbi:MAG: V-type ATPase subunit [Spirochaetaceae bacterium]|nr:V-type ATPase subunit [Spirochaetaceae bacterium]
MSISERSFLYAKACGIYGKSFLKSRAAELDACSSLDALCALLGLPPLPASLSGGAASPSAAASTAASPQAAASQGSRGAALSKLETQIHRNAEAQIRRLLDTFARIPPLLLVILRRVEVEDLSNALAAAGGGEAECPPHTDLGRSASVDFSLYPDLERMLAESPYQALSAHIKKIDISKNYTFYQAELDKMYWRGFFSAVQKSRPADCRAAAAIGRAELELQNAARVLRLRVYYGLGAEDVKAHLINIQPDGTSRPLDRQARAALDYPLDHRAPWQGWRFAAFLNPETPGVVWRADPRAFENNAAFYIYKMAKKKFHAAPFSLDTAAAFMYLKRTEARLLAAAAEGLALGIQPAETFKMLSFEGYAA